jgi:RNA polymerase sigma factor (sigma-70 family)
MTDHQLLARYVSGGSAGAFAQIVRRYSDMVYSACLRILGDAAAAEDASQATFLVLVRSAPKLSRSTNLSGWLFVTAGNAARKLRRAKSRRARHEREAATMRENEPGAMPVTWESVRPELDLALASLPRGQRNAIVLRYFRERSEREIAEETGCPRGTVSARLTRGLSSLRRRLARRGAALSAGALAGLLAERAVGSAPAGLAEAIQAVCIGTTTASASVLTLAKGVSKMVFWAKLKVITAALCAVTVLSGAGVLLVTQLRAAEPRDGQKKVERRGPLAKLPGKPGAHIARIKALGDNAWLDLGKPAPDPRYGAAPGRAFTNKMAYAGDMGGAFLYGEGGHGKAMMRGGRLHYNDDLWFYNVNAHAWICAYPGTDVKNFKMTIDENGFEVAADGQHLPIAVAVHGYESTAYLPDIGKFMATATGGVYWRKHLGARRATWGFKPKGAKGQRLHPFFYDVKTARWKRRKAKCTGQPPGPGACNALIHLPGLKQVASYARKNHFWFFDYSTDTWSHVKPKGPAPRGDYEGVSCYDSKRRRIYVCNRNRYAKPPLGRFGIYDVAANTWIESKAKVRPDKVAGLAGDGSYMSNSATLHYDSRNDVVLLAISGSRKPGLYAYDPEKDEWTAGPVSPARGGYRHTFYDPQHNAHFFYCCGDSSFKPGNIMVYRYKVAKKEATK